MPVACQVFRIGGGDKGGGERKLGTWEGKQSLVCLAGIKMKFITIIKILSIGQWKMEYQEKNTTGKAKANIGYILGANRMHY